MGLPVEISLVVPRMVERAIESLNTFSWAFVRPSASRKLLADGICPGRQELEIYSRGDPTLGADGLPGFRVLAFAARTAEHQKRA